MIYLYGDSHIRFSFKQLPVPHRDYHEPSITMFRIGRDNTIINFNRYEHDSNSIICIAYGEVDSRCHIQRQVDVGKEEDVVITELVEKYFTTLHNTIRSHKKVIIVGVIPPIRQMDYESIHGPISHEFPFVGTDDARVRYTRKINTMICQLCRQYEYIYFNPYERYEREDGTLQYEYSDQVCHLGNNAFFLEEFMKLYDTFV